METKIHQKELNNVYKALSVLNLPELEQVMQRIIGIRKRKLPNVLSEAESELLRKINKPISREIQKRYDALLVKQRNESITETDHEELLEITTYIENQNVRRLSYLIDLAKIRNISLDELIEQLDLNPRLDVA